MTTSLAPYSVLPVGAGDVYTAPVADPQSCLFLSPRAIDLATVVAAITFQQVRQREHSDPWKNERRNLGGVAEARHVYEVAALA